jgi:hypothetical protein
VSELSVFLPLNPLKSDLASLQSSETAPVWPQVPLLCSAVGIWPCSTHRAALFVDFFFSLTFPILPHHL